MEQQFIAHNTNVKIVLVAFSTRTSKSYYMIVKVDNFWISYSFFIPFGFRIRIFWVFYYNTCGIKSCFQNKYSILMIQRTYCRLLKVWNSPSKTTCTLIICFGHKVLWMAYIVQVDNVRRYATKYWFHNNCALIFKINF